MKLTLTTALSAVLLVLGVLFYLTAVSGLLFHKATPPGDVGVVSSSVILVLFGVVGLLLERSRKPSA